METGSLTPGPVSHDIQSAQSEDCHFLNIWAPSAEHIPKGGLPVMIWLYGGALASGETSMDAYSGHRLVARSIEIGKPVIFVSINYRVNVFGYLASKELQEWSGDGSAGNYGFYDQRMGILVAKQIIGSFGGDPNNVTCFGESAGAVSADVLSAAFHGEKLFNRMILQSATVDTMKSKTVAQAQRHFDLFYSKVGGPADLQGRARVEYLLSKSTDDLIKAYAASLPSMIFFPVIDEHFLSTDPSELPRDVDAVLQGTCRDEGTLFSAPLPADSRTARLTELMIRAAVPKPHAAEALQRYSADKHGDAREAYSAYINDAWFQHPSRVHARVVAGQGKKVFRYRMEGEVDSLKKLGLRAFHASEWVLIAIHVASVHDTDLIVASIC